MLQGRDAIAILTFAARSCLLLAQQLAQERYGDAALGGERRTVDLIEQRAQTAQITRVVREQEVQHCRIERDAARLGAFAQYVAPLRIVERAQCRLGAGGQARHQVRQDDADLRRRSRRHEYQRAAFGSATIIQIKKRMLGCSDTGNRIDVVEHEQVAATEAADGIVLR